MDKLCEDCLEEQRPNISPDEKDFFLAENKSDCVVCSDNYYIL